MTMVSVLVASRNEKAQIAACLESILANDYPPDRLEVLVIDGMSTDGTRDVVEELSRKHSSIRLLDNAKRTAAAAFNIGVEESLGEIVLIMSAHARYSGDYVSACVRHLEESGADDVGGSMITVPESGSVAARGIAAVLSHPFGVGNAQFRLQPAGPIWTDTVFGGCYRKGVFSKIGSFDERLVRGWDMDFNNRLRKGGGRILLVPSIRVWYVPKGGLRGFLLQNLRDGFWALRAIAVSGRSFRLRHFVPAAFVSAVALGGALSLAWRPARWTLAAIGSAYLALAFASGIQLAFRERDARLGFLAPALFALRHFSYGIGSVAGFVRSLASPRRRSSLQPSRQPVSGRS